MNIKFLKVRKDIKVPAIFVFMLWVAVKYNIKNVFWKVSSSLLNKCHFYELLILYYSLSLKKDIFNNEKNFCRILFRNFEFG